jgi:DNA polymerase III subunit chi
LTDIQFYQLLATPLDIVLPKLLEKAVGKGMRAVVATGSAERAQSLDTVLWTYSRSSFLAHGRSGADTATAAQQPVWLAVGIENPNAANLLIVLDGQQPTDYAAWERVCDMFDGTDETALANARLRWKTLKDAGHALSYWRQTAAGGWEKAA